MVLRLREGGRGGSMVKVLGSQVEERRLAKIVEKGSELFRATLGSRASRLALDIFLVSTSYMVLEIS